MGKFETIRELVEWTTGNDSNSNFCVGTFSRNANKPYILKELINAPIDKETMKSRIYRKKCKDDKAFFKPTSTGYSEDYVKIYTDKNLDDYDFRDAKLPYTFVESGKEKLNNVDTNFYIFKVNTREEEF